MLSKKKFTQPHKLYLHVGLHKTGTSSIQESLIKNKKFLKKEDIIVLSNLPNISQISRQNSLNDSLIKKCILELHDNLSRYQTKPVKIIISNEGLSGNPYNGYKYTKAIAENLSKVTKSIDTKIIIYLRKQDEFVESLYIQSIKEGKTHDFNEFLKSFRNNAFDWCKYLNIWLRYFSKNQLLIRLYDKQFLKDNILYDFANIIKSEVLQNDKENYNVNLGYSKNALEVARKLNQYISKDEIQRIRTLLEKIEPRKRFDSFSLFTDEIREEYLASYKSSNIELGNRFLSLCSEKYFRLNKNKIKNQVNQKLDIESYTKIISKIIGFFIEENKMLRYKTNPTIKNLSKMLYFYITKSK